MKKIKKSDDVVKLDVACGQRKQEGFIGVDIAATKDADIVYDLNVFPWSFAEDESVDEIYCAHYVEHTDDMMSFMNEIGRILKMPTFDPANPNVVKSGFARIIAPYYNSMRCWQDPTHKRAISEASFLYYNKKWREDNGLDHYPITSDLNFMYSFNLDASAATRSQEWQGHAFKHYTNVINDIVVTVWRNS